VPQLPDPLSMKQLQKIYSASQSLASIPGSPIHERKLRESWDICHMKTSQVERT